jgi:hypothetical protein
MALSDAFYQYARLSKGKKQKIGYWGVESVSPQTPDSTAYWPIEILPGDATTAILDPVITYPQPTDIYDLPGKIGGPVADGDNSLSYAGSDNNIASPMTLDLTVPDHTIDSLTLSTGDLEFIKPTDQGETATVTVFVISRYVSTSEVAKLVSGAVTMQYWDGSTYASATPVFGWEGGATMTYTVALASASTDQIKWKVCFNSGFDVVAADYEFHVSVAVGGVVKAEEVDTAAVS